MPIREKDLTKPIDSDNPTFAAFLDDLQGNILKGHGRELTANVFVRFDPGKAEAARTLLAELADRVTSAKAQLEQVDEYQRSGKGGGLVVFVFLAASGYAALGLPDAKIPKDAAFQAGMSARRTILADPVQADWEPHLAGVDGMILIGHESVKGLDMEIARLAAALDAAGIELAGIEIGRARFNAHGNGIEHFGYVDGRSQPLLLKRDVEAEKSDRNGGTSRWDPAFSPIDTVLVQDPGGAGTESFGSFFVFRKLEQNVRAFKQKEMDLAVALGLDPESDAAELAGALVVGRFEDGTPVIFSRMATGNGSVPNDFNYDGDPDGKLCPFAAHIRKTNPRGDVARQHGLPKEVDRTPIMARRGIPYGVRSDDGESIPAMPTGGVGLLFMAYQRSLVDQFEFTQATWVNDEDFLRDRTGIDPVIGQSLAPEKAHVAQTWRVDAHSPETRFHFAHFVTLKGGDYFFAPSISCLKSLAAPLVA